MSEHKLHYVSRNGKFKLHLYHAYFMGLCYSIQGIKLHIRKQWKNPYQMKENIIWNAAFNLIISKLSNIIIILHPRFQIYWRWSLRITMIAQNE